MLANKALNVAQTFSPVFAEVSKNILCPKTSEHAQNEPRSEERKQKEAEKLLPATKTSEMAQKKILAQSFIPDTQNRRSAGEGVSRNIAHTLAHKLYMYLLS